MKTKTNVRAASGPPGTGGVNHNQTLRVRSQVKAGWGGPTGTGGINHNQTLRKSRRA